MKIKIAGAVRSHVCHLNAYDNRHVRENNFQLYAVRLPLCNNGFVLQQIAGPITHGKRRKANFEKYEYVLYWNGLKSAF
jgi:hypothetical protein